MFGRRKKPEGFEWHKYVRTTIKLRREARRDKADQLKRSAAEGIRAAGDAAGGMAKQGARQFAAGAKVAGGAAGFAARRGADLLAAAIRVAAGSAARAASAFARHLGSVASAAGHGLALIARSDVLRPAMDVLSRPGVSSPLAIAGAIGVLAGLARAALGFGLDPDAGIALLVGFLCLLAAYGPRAVRGTAPTLPGWITRIRPPARRIVALSVTACVLGVIAWSFLPGRVSLPVIGHLASLQFTAGPAVEGRAAAVSGDVLRVGSTFVRLVGIEAPEREQRCLRPGNRRWRCAEAAHDALARLVHGRVVKCESKGLDAANRTMAVCLVGKADIAAELVKAGHVFAESGFLARYSGLEAEARTAKLGLWRGEAERPQDFRSRAWEQAKRAAPEGCPIKGRAAGGAKVYLLPWSADYARVRVSRARGDRWFCSEQEAISAGWRPIERG